MTVEVQREITSSPPDAEAVTLRSFEPNRLVLEADTSLALFEPRVILASVPYQLV